MNHISLREAFRHFRNYFLIFLLKIFDMQQNSIIFFVSFLLKYFRDSFLNLNLIFLTSDKYLYSIRFLTHLWGKVPKTGFEPMILATASKIFQPSYLGQIPRTDFIQTTLFQFSLGLFSKIVQLNKPQ